MSMATQTTIAIYPGKFSYSRALFKNAMLGDATDKEKWREKYRGQPMVDLDFMLSKFMGVKSNGIIR